MPNKGLLQTGAMPGVALTRVEGSQLMSFDAWPRRRGPPRIEGRSRTCTGPHGLPTRPAGVAGGGRTRNATPSTRSGGRRVLRTKDA